MTSKTPVISLMVWCVAILVTTSLPAQQLKEMGMLATGVLSRTRSADGEFQTGDMIYVTAFQPASSGKMYVSAHMEYLDTNKDWIPVPTKDTELGNAYKSGLYPGLRDYVEFEKSTINYTRHVCLFMPYEAADLPEDKKYSRRYSLRVWDNNNDPIERIILSPEEVSTSKDENGNFTITTVRAKACASPMAPNGTEPSPESKDDGMIRFFNTKSGAFVCPAGE